MAADIPAPGVVHFYSYATGVSIELPVGFECVDDGDGTAAYSDEADRRDAPAPRLVRIRVIGALGHSQAPEAVHQLADGFAAAADGVLVSRGACSVDGAPTETVVLRRPDGALLHQTAAAADEKLLAVVATAPSEAHLEAYDTAIGSIRFIAL